MVKSHEKEMSNTFFCDYDVVKCRQNNKFQEMNTEPLTRKNVGF